MDIDQYKSLIDSVKSPGEDGVPETVYDDLSNSFAEVHGNYGAATSKIGELEAANTTLLEENNAIKLKMYDSLLATPEVVNEEPAGEPAPSGISSLFDKD